MSAHAPIAPSGFKTIRLCAGSLQAQRGLPDTSSEEAKEGVFGHWARDICLKGDMDAHELIGEKRVIEGTEFEFTAQYARYIQRGLDHSRDLRDALGGKMYVEKRVSMEDLIPDCWGTADTGIIAPSINVVTDLKFGAGIPISAEWNEQLMLYALGFYLEFRHRITSRDWLLIIDQPRVGAGISEFRCTTSDLLEFADEANRIIRIAEQPGAKRTPGVEQCRFCKARGNCIEFAEYNLSLFGITLEEIEFFINMGWERVMLKPVREMTTEQKTFVLLNADLFTSWLKDLHASVLSDARIGRPTPGMKMIEGRRGHRKWKDEEELVAFLKERMRIDTIYEMRLKSPAQMEGTVLGPKLWKKINQFGWIVQGEAKPALVPATDKRPAIAPATSKLFNLDMDKSELI